MKVSTKFISSLGPDQVQHLETLAAQDPARRVRMRAHSILLSFRGASMNEIAQIYQVHRDTVSCWLDRFAQDGVDGLSDQPRCGGPTKLTASEQAVAHALLARAPNAPKTVLAQLREQTGKTISPSTLTRMAKAADLRWKRVRKSLKDKRDDAAFAQATKEIDRLKKTPSRTP